ncbi:serine/threonine-protein kinase [Actinorugispora endophytica]|uniref:Serine/threonine protein kinase n=1 Tax=Actinorugispora endophytica TaxID=1605990 RepID=A0A4R6UNR3_9ACTN|nr:serine/threonine-protein kinase [Actinorugispora endophytica]TDQ48780.1 serine/threonine protein kinase [Actinorugispora endophytica]
MTPNGHERAKPLRTGDPTELGDYRILGRLGRGGMGTVYLAKDPTGRNVAVKLIHPGISDDDAFRRRFAREVESARSVARFSTAAVIDARLDGDPLFIVSEYVAGPNLAEAIAADGPMDGGTLESLAMGVAAALTAIHGAGVIHRDLKPANVLLSSVGPKVIDFGIARAMDDDGAVTRSSQLMGTPAYLAPELIAGEPLAPPSDIFSWGCLVAFAGTGRAPFNGPTVPAVLHQIISAAPNLTGLDSGVKDLVEAALDKNPDNRPTAQQLLNRLVGQEAPSPTAVNETMARSWTPPSTARPVDADSGPNPTAGAAGPPSGPDAAPTFALAQEPTSALPGPETGPGQPPSDRFGPPSGGQPGFHGPSAGHRGVHPAAHPPGLSHPPQARYSPPPPGPGPQYSPSGPNNAYSPPFGQPPVGHGGDYGGGTPSGGGARTDGTPSGGRFPAKTAGAGALALVVVAGTVLGGIWLFGDPQVPEGTEIYSDDFTVRDDGWGDRAFDPSDTYYWSGYHQDGYALGADGDDRQSTSMPAPTGPLPEQVRVSATARVLSGPDYGTFGLYCLRSGEDDDVTFYRANVRVDGTEAEIRREAGAAGSRHLARSSGGSVPGFTATEEGAEEPVVNTLDFTCELDTESSTVDLNLWVNGEHVLEASDGNPLPVDGEEAPGAGITVGRGVGGGQDIVTVFDDFALYRLGEGEPVESQG